MDTDFGVDTLEEAISCYGATDLFNSGSGAQITSDALSGVLKATGIQISVDGKGCWIGNVFVERLWCSLKYEEVYLKAYDSVSEARSGVGIYFRFYNCERMHHGLNRQKPYHVREGSVT